MNKELQEIICYFDIRSFDDLNASHKTQISQMYLKTDGLPYIIGEFDDLYILEILEKSLIDDIDSGNNSDTVCAFVDAIISYYKNEISLAIDEHAESIDSEEYYDLAASRGASWADMCFENRI